MLDHAITVKDLLELGGVGLVVLALLGGIVWVLSQIDLSR